MTTALITSQLIQLTSQISGKKQPNISYIGLQNPHFRSKKMLTNNRKLNCLILLCQCRVFFYRNNPIYIKYYMNVTRTFLLGIIPFAALIFFNIRIYQRFLVTRRRYKRTNNKSSQVIIQLLFLVTFRLLLYSIWIEYILTNFKYILTNFEYILANISFGSNDDLVTTGSNYNFNYSKPKISN